MAKRASKGEKYLLGRLKPETERTMCVYRYTDIYDGVIKYVGIVRKGTLASRIAGHSVDDGWCKNRDWFIEYFPCESKSEIEAFESHLIALYGTDKYYNKKKAGWGINRFLPNVEEWWMPASNLICDDFETMRVVVAFRRLLRAGKPDEAMKFYKLLEFEREGET